MKKGMKELYTRLMRRDEEIGICAMDVLKYTVIAVVLIAKSLGCALPLAAKKLHLDPALMASPLLATVCDTCVVLIYFNIATLFMNIMG